MTAQDSRAGLYLDVDFAPEYKLAGGYVQRISMALRVPQPEGMTLPTSIQDPKCQCNVQIVAVLAVPRSPDDQTYRRNA